MTLEDLKKVWEVKYCEISSPSIYDQESLDRIIHSRVKEHIKNSFQYFWASFALQVIVYSLLSHIIIKYGQDSEILFICIGCALLFLPFTIVLMQKFKRIALTKPSLEKNTSQPLHAYIIHQQTALRSFYKFKKIYELFLIPLGCLIAVFLTFKIYVPGGVYAHWTGTIIAFVISLLSCVAAIRSENKKSFKTPIQQLQNILNEFNQEEKGE